MLGIDLGGVGDPSVEQTPVGALRNAVEQVNALQALEVAVEFLGTDGERGFAVGIEHITTRIDGDWRGSLGEGNADGHHVLDDGIGAGGITLYDGTQIDLQVVVVDDGRIGLLDQQLHIERMIGGDEESASALLACYEDLGVVGVGAFLDANLEVAVVARGRCVLGMGLEHGALSAGHIHYRSLVEPEVGLLDSDGLLAEHRLAVEVFGNDLILVGSAGAAATGAEHGTPVVLRLEHIDGQGVGGVVVAQSEGGGNVVIACPGLEVLGFRSDRKTRYYITLGNPDAKMRKRTTCEENMHITSLGVNSIAGKRFRNACSSLRKRRHTINTNDILKIFE